MTGYPSVSMYSGRLPLSSCSSQSAFNSLYGTICKIELDIKSRPTAFARLSANTPRFKGQTVQTGELGQTDTHTQTGRRYQSHYLPTSLSYAVDNQTGNSKVTLYLRVIVFWSTPQTDPLYSDCCAQDIWPWTLTFTSKQGNKGTKHIYDSLTLTYDLYLHLQSSQGKGQPLYKNEG